MREVRRGAVLSERGPLTNAHATAFIDPFFSSGVHLALTGALSASLTIAASIRGTVSEERAARWHDSKVGTAYTRYGPPPAHRLGGRLTATLAS